jgi:8-oxo-dGTP pyrophosphatase MutT (NUDIX family)
MADLQHFQAHYCLTASGCLVHEGKVLLVKHKKLGLWLNPGGHLESNELPHQAAEREFWEETGVKVAAVSSQPAIPDERTEFLPQPVLLNLHWVSEENYQARHGQREQSAATKKNWGKGCEQHANFMYLVQPVNGVAFKQNLEETDGIAWFTLEELQKMHAEQPDVLTANILTEVTKVMAVAKQSLT